MDVLGKDTQAQAYRVALDLGGGRVVALVSDTLLSAQYGQDAKVSHQLAYEWIATQRHALETAIKTLVKGAAPLAPFDQITLEGR